MTTCHTNQLLRIVSVGVRTIRRGSVAPFLMPLPTITSAGGRGNHGPNHREASGTADIPAGVGGVGGAAVLGWHGAGVCCSGRRCRPSGSGRCMCPTGSRCGCGPRRRKGGVRAVADSGAAGAVSDQTFVLSGLADKVAVPLPGEGIGDHARASSTWLTGVRVKKTEGPDIRAGVSLDQLAAQHLGKETQLGVAGAGAGLGGGAGGVRRGV